MQRRTFLKLLLTTIGGLSCFRLLNPPKTKGFICPQCGRLKEPPLFMCGPGAQSCVVYSPYMPLTVTKISSIKPIEWRRSKLFVGSYANAYVTINSKGIITPL
jgi:hypothetical protein